MVLRPHTTASRTYKKTSRDRARGSVGFRDAYSASTTANPVYIDKVDTLPVRTADVQGGGGHQAHSHGRGVSIHSLIRSTPPFRRRDRSRDRGSRFIFGFGSGFPSPLFAMSAGCLTRIVTSAYANRSI